MALETQIAAAAKAWLDDPAIAEADKVEIRSLIASADHNLELTDRFYRTLEFGTGGLRGILGSGTNRMNLYTVGATAQGLANYIKRGVSIGTPAPSMAIAFDCRRMSAEFARHVACVMAANGITAHLFEAPRPTPHLSFAVRQLGCTAGVVITASHNPPEYNGFKAYWAGGGQVVPPHDEAIINEVRHVGAFSDIRALPIDEAASAGLVRMLGREMDEAFLAAVNTSCLNADACARRGAEMKIVYTNLHGTGGSLIPEALRRRGFQRVIEVREQARPDGEFPTVKSPNPEEPAALAMGIELARREGAELVIGTDPDADRMGIAVRGRDGAFSLLTGNQIGALLCHYLCDELTRQGRFPPNGAVISTIVSSDLMKEIGRSFGADIIETLTGFKYIAEQIRVWEASRGPKKIYVFGAEESYGYMPCTYVRDKDAVTSAALIAELAAVCAERGTGLYALLEGLYRRHGYFEEGTKSITMPGKDGSERIRAIMNRLRSKPPRSIGGVAVIAMADLLSGEKREAGGHVVARYELPASDVMMFFLEDGAKVIARPSGTEPKIKFYILVRQPGTDLAAARNAASARLSAIGTDVGTWTGE